jgi:hypothetical protein
MLAVDATVASIVSAAAAVVGMLAYLYSLRRAEQSAAREEAVALAELRRQTVIELERRVAELEAALAAARGDDPTAAAIPRSRSRSAPCTKDHRRRRP